MIVWRALTLTQLDVELVVPCAVLEAVDDLFIQSVAGISPVGLGTEVLDCSGVRSGIHSILPCPVIHPQVVVPNREGRLSAVDRCTSTRSHCSKVLSRYSRMHWGMTVPPWSGLGVHTASSAHSISNDSGISGIGSGCSLWRKGFSMTKPGGQV